MAEGGYDPETTNPFKPHEGDDDRTPLIPRHRGDEEEIEMRHRTSTQTTSTNRQTWQHTEETSFGSTPSGVMEMRAEAVDALTKVFYEPDTTKIFVKMGEKGVVSARLKGDKNIIYPILKDGEVLFTKDGKIISDYGRVFKYKGKDVIVPKTIRNALGKTIIEVMDEKRIANERAEERIKELRESKDNAFPEDRERIDAEIEREQEGINDRNQDIEREQERLTLRQRIKEIFKKYSFTAFCSNDSHWYSDWCNR